VFAISDSSELDADLARLTEAQHTTPHGTSHEASNQESRRPLSAASRDVDLDPDLYLDANSNAGFGALERKREQSEFQQLLAYALKALARREHSAVELRRKLHGYFDRSVSRSEQSLDDLSQGHRHKGNLEDPINRVIEALILDGSLSDERFAAEFVRSRVRKGYGPVRIRMDLLERGVPDRLAEDELTRPTEYWQQLAVEACVRKFGHWQAADGQPELLVDRRAESLGSAEPDDASPAEIRRLMRDRKAHAQRQWNRCARFLSQRGFPADLIYRTLDGRLLD